MIEYPALNGEVVTEAHARICRERGHATYTQDGIESDFCPRCGVRKLIDATKTAAAVLVLMMVDVEIGRLRREDRHLTFLDTFSLPLGERPTNAVERRQEAISRVFYTWERREHEDREAVAQDIETLASLGRTERWKTAVRTWAHIAREDPQMFAQYSTYTNYAAL